MLFSRIYVFSEECLIVTISEMAINDKQKENPCSKSGQASAVRAHGNAHGNVEYGNGLGNEPRSAARIRCSNNNTINTVIC